MGRIWGGLGYIGGVCLLVVLSAPVQGAGLIGDRAEREPGDRDRGDGFVSPRHYPTQKGELEPGDAAGQGDFGHVDALDREREPGEDDGDRARKYRRQRPRGGTTILSTDPQ